jgi:hypothetical protein
MPTIKELETALAEIVKLNCTTFSCELAAQKAYGETLARNADIVRAALQQTISAGQRKFNLGDRVRKIRGASWQGRVVGFYSASLTPIGYAVESERESGNVQVYPEQALESVPDVKEEKTNADN